MNTISGFPYFEVQFNKEGALHDDHELRQVLSFISQGKMTDLFVISHGWNNDMNEARDLYKSFFAQMRSQINNNRSLELGSKAFAVLGILWPSKKYADEDLIPSGAADFSNVPSEEEKIKQQIESLKGVFDHPEADSHLERAKALVDRIGTNENAAVEFVNLIRTLPHKNEVNTEDNTDEFFKLSGDELVNKLSRPDLPIDSTDEMGGAADFNPSASVMNEGEAANFDLLGGIKSAVQKVLNFTTYYQMKERAGVVGRRGAYQVLMQIKEIAPSLKMHLIGHSFGGRLVTSIAQGPEGSTPIKPASMTLLQAAFSHHGFAENFDGTRDGFFRKVVEDKKVKGPILITHSVKDVAVGKAYPIASKLSGDDAATFGGPESRFGGIGRNGAQFTPEADNSIPLGPVTSTYRFQSGKLYNLKADTLIMDHSDVTKAEIVHAVLSAIAIT
jgi:hypothetical protein